MKSWIPSLIARVRAFRVARFARLPALVFSALALMPAGDVAAATINVSPTVTPLSAAEIGNPMRGYIRWGGKETVPQTEPARDAYTRLSWTDLEGDTAGSYSFTALTGKIQEGIAAAKAAGGPKAKYSFGIRVMKGTSDVSVPLVPAYVRSAMIKGFTHNIYNSDGTLKGTNYIPDWNDPYFISRFNALLAQVASIYDGHPDIGFFEMIVYGTYGEWNKPGVYTVVQPSGLPQSSAGGTEATSPTLHSYVDIHVANFHRTQLLMMTDNEDALVYAMGLSPTTWPTGVAPWIGWSRKSLGDPQGHFTTGMTPAKLAAITDRWKKAPVFGEFFGGGRTDGTVALQETRNFHVSVIGNGNLDKAGSSHEAGWSTYPAAQQADFIQAGKEAGYRFSLTNFTIPETLYTGGTLTAQAQWQNAGLNPLFEPFTVQYQLRSGGTVVQQWNSTLDLEDWTKIGATPTLHADTFALAGTVAPGTYSLSVVVSSLDGTRDPIKLAIGTARNTDSSYTLGNVVVNASPTLGIENFDDGDVTNPAWTTSTGSGGGVLFWVSQTTWPAAPDASAKYVKIEFNSTATYQYAVLNRGTGVFGTAWANAGANAICFWFKGSASNVVSANNRVRVQLRESENGERWSYDLGNAASNGSWQQITVPFSALYRLAGDGMQTPGGTANIFDLSLIDQIRFFDNSNPTALAIYVDRIEVLRQ
ncbi:MAG: DUF4832 domain-containing protein [Undibacterium sp.]|nr:DUF4832 domain-containing protein [Opitutaceae bacterium]